MRRRCIRKRSEDARDFVRSLLKAKVKERPTMAAVLKLPWIKGKNRDHEPSPNSERASFHRNVIGAGSSWEFKGVLGHLRY